MKFKKPLSALVVSALLLGGASGALAASAGLAGALSLCALVLPPLQLLALGSLPCAVALCFRTHGLGPCLRGCVTTLGASLILGGGAQGVLNQFVVQKADGPEKIFGSHTAIPSCIR